MPLGLRGANEPAVDAWAPAPRGLIAPFIVMDVVASANRLAAEGRDILHLEVGQPGASAPLPAIAAARTKLDNDRLGYTDSVGIPALREAIVAFYRQRYSIMIDPGCVVVVPGLHPNRQARSHGRGEGAHVASTLPRHPALGEGCRPPATGAGPIGRSHPHDGALMGAGVVTARRPR